MSEKRQLIPNGGNDEVYTPDPLARDIIGHFKPHLSGDILEPCAGGGAFVRALAHHGFKKVTALEITRGTDFFEFFERVDWVITNPPWSLTRSFALHAYEIANNVVFLITINHMLGLRARLRDMKLAGFGLREVLLVATPPPPWPQSGFQLGAVWLQRGWRGSMRWTSLGGRT